MSKGNKGFSIMGAMVAAGMMGGLALLLAQLTKEQVATQKKAETGVEIVSISQRILRVLYDGSACLNTLGTGTPIATGTIPVNSIQDKNNRALFTVGQTYRNRLVKIASINLKVADASGGQAEAVLQVEMSRESSAFSGQKLVTKSFPLTLELDTSDNLTACTPQTAMVEPVLQSMCGIYGGSTAWDTTNRECNLGICSGAGFMRGFRTSSGGMCDTPNFERTCPERESLVGFQGGVPQCSALGCSALTDAQVRADLGIGPGVTYATPAVSCGDETTAYQRVTCRSAPGAHSTTFSPLGCCYEGGTIVANTNECAATHSGKNLRVRYCRQQVDNGQTACQASGGYQTPKYVNCGWCNRQHLVSKNDERYYWGCSSRTQTLFDNGQLEMWTHSNCIKPEYTTLIGQGDKCKLDTSRRVANVREFLSYSLPWNNNARFNTHVKVFSSPLMIKFYADALESPYGPVPPDECTPNTRP